MTTTILHEILLTLPNCNFTAIIGVDVLAFVDGQVTGMLFLFLPHALSLSLLFRIMLLTLDANNFWFFCHYSKYFVIGYI